MLSGSSKEKGTSTLPASPESLSVTTGLFSSESLSATTEWAAGSFSVTTWRLLLYLLMLFVVAGGCDDYTQDTFREQYAVESYLVANDKLPWVRLSTTSEVDEEYRLNEHYVEDAQVELRLLNSDSTVAETYPYTGDGEYYPVNDSAIVQAGRMYQLNIEAPDGHQITSTTQVPGAFRTVNDLKERYVFEGEEQVRVTMTPSEYPGRKTFYIFTVNVVDPSKERLTPFYHDLVVNEGQHMGIYYKNSYGIFSEESYRQHSNGRVTLPVPWLAVAYYGENDITVNAIDDNMYDFMRTQRAQSSGSESILSGELRGIEYNIDGGVGIFGSFASDTNRVEIVPPGGY